MKLSILLLALFALCALALPVQQQINAAFDELPATDDKVIEHINSVQDSWVAGHNARFRGMKIKDVKKLCGARNSDSYHLPAKEHQVGAIPDTFDARTQWPNCIGPIRDQGHCGSCWAFGAAESLGDRFCIQSKGSAPLILAPQDLTSCDSSNGGCNGGYPISAWKYMQGTGIVTEACYPYEMGTCQHPGCSDEPTPKCNKTCANGANWNNDKHHAASAYSVGRSVSQIQTEIMTHGPVEGTFTVYSDFNNYKSGVYHHVTGSMEGGHAIKILGWGTQNSTDYWLVANSWNTSWGMDGFFLIRRGTNECGIEGGVTAGLAKI